MSTRAKYSTQIQSIITQATQAIKSFVNRYKQKKLTLYIGRSLVIVVVVFGLYHLWSTLYTLHTLSSNHDTVRNLQTYGTLWFSDDIFIEQPRTIDEVIDRKDILDQDITIYANYNDSLQVAYTYFLQSLYLPSQFIREDRFQETIDDSLVGDAYLKANPFSDIQLIQDRTRYTRSINDGISSIELNDVRIGEWKEFWGYYEMPITLSFTAPNKRLFLMLVQRLGATSHASTIGLINEFIYYLWEASKELSIDQLQTQSYADESLDKALWFYLTSRVERPFQDSNIITQDVIRRAIQEAAGCSPSMSQEACDYLLRQKYKDIHHLVYPLTNTTDTQQALHTFFQQLTPLLSIEDFTYNKIKSPIDDTEQYQWTIRFTTYARSVTTENITQVQNHLGSLCYPDKSPFTIANNKTKIQAMVRSLSSLTAINQSQSNALLSIQESLNELEDSYDRLSNFQKVVRTFETYRTFQQIGVCQ